MPEQEKYRDWLKSQPPEEVLNHAYEYTVREDIVMAMEELELTDTQAQALLESPSPLADVYRTLGNHSFRLGMTLSVDVEQRPSWITSISSRLPQRRKSESHSFMKKN